MRHEIVTQNSDIEARFYLSEDTGSYVSPHWHDSLEMVYMLEGSVTVVYENRKTVLHANEFNIINSRVIHSVVSGKNKALVLQIPKEVLKKYVSDFEAYIFEVDMQPKNEVQRTKLDKMKKIFTDMYVVYNIQPEGYLLRFNSLLYELLFTLIHSYSVKLTRDKMNKNNRKLEKVDEIMVYIKKHYKEKVTIHSLALQFGYSDDYLSKFFKQEMGMTIIEYLYTIRIAKVYQELINTDRNIREIFEEHGCSNYRVAMRVFREMYGCTPKEKKKEKKREISLRLSSPLPCQTQNEK